MNLLFLHAHREASVLGNELSEESDQFRYLHVSCFANLKVAVGLIMAKASTMRISIPLDLSSRTCIPLPLFSCSGRPAPLLDPSLVLFPPCSAQAAHVECLFLAFHWLHYSSSWDLAWHFSFPWSSPFFILLEINYYWLYPMQRARCLWSCLSCIFSRHVQFHGGYWLCTRTFTITITTSANHKNQSV
jgi:hypothetical protein